MLIVADVFVVVRGVVAEGVGRVCVCWGGGG